MQKRDEDKKRAAERPVPDPGARTQSLPVTLQDIYRYRYHHGANLGSIFVLEKWLFSRMFDDSAQGGSELDAVQAYDTWSLYHSK